MAFKFPFTNYHELNLTWVLEQLKKLFEESEENVQTIETYDDRLSAVETEVTDLESTTTQAINIANAAATNAATALSRANTANENALTAGSQAGAAVTAAQGALQEAQAATQAAQQAQATAMTFDGRITQAQNDASAAVQEAQSFENRVNAAINTANNAANTATIAQGIAVNANQTAATALDTAQTADTKADQNAENIGDLSELVTPAKSDLVAAINDASQMGAVTSVNGKTGVVVIDAGDLSYNSSETYNPETVGAELHKQKNDINAIANAGRVSRILYKDYIVTASGITPIGSSDKDINRTYPAKITVTNKSSIPGNVQMYLNLDGNLVPSVTSGEVTINAGASYTWEVPVALGNVYGVGEGYFSPSYSFCGFSVSNPNSLTLSFDLVQDVNPYLEYLFTAKRMVICRNGDNGDGFFGNIQNAVDFLKRHYNVSAVSATVYLMNGTYNLNYVSSRSTVINKGANRISIIGESRDGVKIILNSTPAHNNKIIEHGGASALENISFFNLWNDDGSTINYTNNSYCIHNDLSFAVNEKYDTVVKNCYVYSEAFAPIGAGLWKNQKQRYIDVEAVFNSADNSTTGYNQWAPIYIHGPSQSNQSDCSVEIDGCTCIAKKGTMAIVLPNVPNMMPYTEIPVSIRRTIGTTTGSTITNVSRTTHDLQPDSALNNVEAWNY